MKWSGISTAYLHSAFIVKCVMACDNRVQKTAILSTRLGQSAPASFHRGCVGGMAFRLHQCVARGVKASASTGLLCGELRLFSVQCFPCYFSQLFVCIGGSVLVFHGGLYGQVSFRVKVMFHRVVAGQKQRQQSIQSLAESLQTFSGVQHRGREPGTGIKLRESQTLIAESSLRGT